MIIQRLSEMVHAKKDEYYSDFLQSFMFNALLSFHQDVSNGNINVSPELEHFVSDCHTYITRDRQLQINALIEAELKDSDNEEIFQIQNGLRKQDEYYCNGILQNRQYIFNKQQ
jgi:hypothetical protein